jgi:hypothetical protein
MGPGADRPLGTFRSLSLRDVILVALLAGLVVFSKAIIRAPLHIPGRSGLFWVAVMVTGQGVIRKRGAGTAMGLVAGLLATVITPGSEGLLTWVKFLAAGVTLDAVAVMAGQRLDRYVAAAAAGALVHMAKLTGMLLVGLAMGIPSKILALGLGASAATHAAFGVAAGLLAAVAIRQLDRIAATGALRGWAPAGRVGTTDEGSRLPAAEASSE